MRDSHPIHKYYTNHSFVNVLQILKEKSSKERAKRQEGRSCARRRRNSFDEAKQFANAKE